MGMTNALSTPEADVDKFYTDQGRHTYATQFDWYRDRSVKGGQSGSHHRYDHRQTGQGPRDSTTYTRSSCGTT